MNENENIMLTVAGEPFQCACGCNVFHAGRKPNQYVCNACFDAYIGTPEANATRRATHDSGSVR